MSEEGFHLFLGVMCVIALFVFIALYFVKAGYGMFRTASWGYSISNKVAWVLMEAPVFIVMFWLWGRSGAGFAVPVYLPPVPESSVRKSFLPAVPATLLPKVVHFSFSAERKKPDAGNYYDNGHCI